MNGYEYRAKKRDLKYRLLQVEESISDLNAKLKSRFGRERAELEAEKARLSREKQRIQFDLSAVNDDVHLLLNEAFMNTVINMMDPQDVTEIWDRVFVDYPYLKDAR